MPKKIDPEKVRTPLFTTLGSLALALGLLLPIHGTGLQYAVLGIAIVCYLASVVGVWKRRGGFDKPERQTVEVEA